MPSQFPVGTLSHCGKTQASSAIRSSIDGRRLQSFRWGEQAVARTNPNGDGNRYAVIFNANRDKIHNPNLIYPGQTFVLPQKTE